MMNRGPLRVVFSLYAAQLYLEHVCVCVCEGCVSVTSTLDLPKACNDTAKEEDTVSLDER